MQKNILVLVLSLLAWGSLPSLAEKATVQIGKVKASINEANENQTVSFLQSGNTITIGYTYSKTKIAGVNTSSTTISQAIQFSLAEGEELAAGNTYDFTSTTALILASSVKNLKTWSVSTLAELSSTPVATGKLKILSYNTDTGEIKAQFSAKFSPSLIVSGTKQTESSKPVAIKANIHAFVD